MLKHQVSKSNTGKLENVDKHNFLLFLNCFLHFRGKISLFMSYLSSENEFNLDRSEILSCGKQYYPITRRQILDFSKLKEFADDNFKFDENGRKLSKQVENTKGKGEIARYEQFLLFPQGFQKTYTADT